MYSQLVTVRAHAQHQLGLAGETDAALARRARWVRDLLAARPRLGRPEEVAWYDALEE